MPKGSTVNDVKEEGGKGFCDDSSKALVIKQVTMGEMGEMGEGGSTIVQNCVTSFMDAL